MIGIGMRQIDMQTNLLEIEYDGYRDEADKYVGKLPSNKHNF